MVWLNRVCVAVAVTAGLTLLAAPASAQTEEIAYALAGVEIVAEPNEGTFVGVAIGPDDFGTWGAVVDHYPLDGSVPITGGSFAINGQVRDLAGSITDGQVTRLGGSCRRETFDVTGHVALFQGGIGAFAIRLTHYGQRVPGGGCVTFFATVEGLITFTY